MKKENQFTASQKIIDRGEYRRQRVNLQAGDEWREEVKQFERDFASYVSENPELQNHFEKWLESIGAIRITSLEPLIFTVKDLVGYERNMIKWDALQELRCRRKFASQQSMAGIVGEQQEAEVIF